MGQGAGASPTPEQRGYSPGQNTNAPWQNTPLNMGNLTSSLGTFGGAPGTPGSFQVGIGPYGALQQGQYRPPAAPPAAPQQAPPTKPDGTGTGAGTSTSTGAVGGTGGTGGPSGLPDFLAGMPEFGGTGTGAGGTNFPAGTSGTGAGSVYGYPGAATVNNSANNGASSSGQMTQGQADFFNGNHNITDPYQVNQNVNSTLASFGMQSVPGAAAFQQGLFNPGFNAAEQAFLNSEGERQTRLLNGQMAQLGNKFGGTPFHSGYLNMGRELGAEAASNLNQTAQGLAVNRQNVAAQQLQRILGDPGQRTEAAQNVVPSMLGLINSLQTAPFAQGLAYLNGSPIMAPTIIPGAQSISGGGGGKK